MPNFEQSNHIRIGKDRIEILGLTLSKTNYPSPWIGKKYTLDFSTLSGGGGTTYTLPTPTITTGTTAPTTPKVGDIWNDTNAASGTKPTILQKIWNGSSWYATTGNSQSGLSYNSATGELGIAINGQTSSNTVNILASTSGTSTLQTFGSPTPGQCQWTRTGNVVHFSATFLNGSTLNGAFDFLADLPIPTTLTSGGWGADHSYQIHATGSFFQQTASLTTPAANIGTLAVWGNVQTGKMRIAGVTAVSMSNVVMSVTGSYLIV